MTNVVAAADDEAANVENEKSKHNSIWERIIEIR